MSTISHSPLARQVFGCGSARRVLAVVLFVALTARATAAESSGAHPVNPRPNTAPTKPPCAAATFARLLPLVGSCAMPSFKGLVTPENISALAHNAAKLLSSNYDNQMGIKPFSNNAAKLLADNAPQVLNGNTVVKVFSDINVNLNVHVENSGNSASGPRGPEGIDAAFKKLDRNGDGKITADEFRAAAGAARP
jgi:hypothetical protein